MTLDIMKLKTYFCSLMEEKYQGLIGSYILFLSSCWLIEGRPELLVQIAFLYLPRFFITSTEAQTAKYNVPEYESFYQKYDTSENALKIRWMHEKLK